MAAPRPQEAKAPAPDPVVVMTGALETALGKIIGKEKNSINRKNLLNAVSSKNFKPPETPDLARLQDLAKVLCKHRVSPTTPKGDNPTVAYALMHFLNHKKNEVFAQQFFDHLKAMKSKPAESKPLIAKLQQMRIECLKEIYRTQDPNQAYHNPWHAGEMKSDAEILKALSEIEAFKDIDQNLLLEIIKTLALTHDRVQGDGPFYNEKNSVLEFVKYHKNIFKGYLSEEALSYIADKVIVDGTLLNLAFGPSKHTAVHRITCDIDIDVIKDYSPRTKAGRDILDIVTAIVSFNDTNRSALRQERLRFPKGMESALDALKKAAGIGDDMNRLQLFIILVGQNMRILADGQFRKFNTDEGMAILKEAFTLARLATLSSDGVAALHAFLSVPKNYNIIADTIRGALEGEIQFGSGMNSREASETLRRKGHDEAADILDEHMLQLETKEEKGHLPNVWAIHTKESLPRLKANFPDQKAQNPNLISGLIFCAANQKGLELASRDEPESNEELRQVCEGNYAISFPDQLSDEQRKLTAIVLMSVALDPKANKMQNTLQFVDLHEYVKREFTRLAGIAGIQCPKFNDEALNKKVLEANAILEGLLGKKIILEQNKKPLEKQLTENKEEKTERKESKDTPTKETADDIRKKIEDITKEIEDIGTKQSQIKAFKNSMSERQGRSLTMDFDQP